MDVEGDVIEMKADIVEVIAILVHSTAAGNAIREKTLMLSNHFSNALKWKYTTYRVPTTDDYLL